MFTACLILCLAPVPRPVDRLTPELMPGKWESLWGGTPSWFCFLTDGTYTYGTADDPSHCGLWEVRAGELWMMERVVHGTTWIEYTVELKLKAYPTMVGVCRGGFQTAVTLRNPKRFAE